VAQHRVNVMGLVFKTQLCIGWTSSGIPLSSSGRSGPNTRLGSTLRETRGAESGRSLGSDQPIRLNRQRKRWIRTRGS